MCGGVRFSDGVDRAAANSPGCDESKPAPHLMKPGAAGGSEVEVKTAALPGLEPTLDRRALMSAVVVQNEMDVEFRGHLLFQLIEKLDELLTAMARQATTDDLAIQDVEGSKQGCVKPLPLGKNRYRSSSIRTRISGNGTELPSGLTARSVWCFPMATLL